MKGKIDEILKELKGIDEVVDRVCSLIERVKKVTKVEIVYRETEQGYVPEYVILYNGKIKVETCRLNLNGLYITKENVPLIQLKIRGKYRISVSDRYL